MSGKNIYKVLALPIVLSILSSCQTALSENQNEPTQQTVMTLNKSLKVSSQQLDMAGQKYWQHDEGNSYGYFNTFDSLKTSNDLAARKVHILLPRDYSTSKKSYPVVYMNDGQTAFFKDNSVGQTWDVAGTLSQLQQNKEIQDVIVVGIHPIIRDKDYTYTEFADKRQCCSLENYAEELAKSIKPFIDKNYRTKSDRQNTAIIGSSHGGLASFYIASHHSKVFGYAASLSPSFWAGLDYNYLDNDQKTLSDSLLVKDVTSVLANTKQRPIFWLDWGLKRTGGNHNSITERLATKRTKEMGQLLQNKFKYISGKDLFLHEDPIGGHDEAAWKYRFGLIVKTFFPAK